MFLKVFELSFGYHQQKNNLINIFRSFLIIIIYKQKIFNIKFSKFFNKKLTKFQNIQKNEANISLITNILEKYGERMEFKNNK